MICLQKQKITQPNNFSKKRQSDLQFVFQETAASFSSLFCFSSSNSRRTSSPYLSIIRTRKSMHRSNSIFCCISSSRYCFDLNLFYRTCWKTTLIDIKFFNKTGIILRRTNCPPLLCCLIHRQLTLLSLYIFIPTVLRYVPVLGQSQNEHVHRQSYKI